MPRRTDITSILLIGSGPIVIGQACEFDYSGTQACKALKEEGYRVILLNSNPATIMTDPELADRTYLEPVTVEVVEQVIERERPDALLPTMGGQTALNIAVGLAKRGTLSKFSVQLIGASAEAIHKAEDREAFKLAMGRIGLKTPESGSARTREEAAGVDTGGSNIQFAVHPETGDLVVIEMNPRVSRSSALASKATGFPIAKIAAKLAVGYTLDELSNDITRVTKAAFEPTIDYVVVKMPRFAFEKFPGADPTLTTQMKSVGEAMAIGRTFKEALQKAIRSLEVDRFGLGSLHGLDGAGPPGANRDELAARVRSALQTPHPDRVWHVADAMRLGVSVEELAALTRIDPWFLDQIHELVEFERRLGAATSSLDPDLLWEAKRLGFSDERLAQLTGVETGELRRRRAAGSSHGAAHGVTYKRVDTCAAEFEAHTPYLYSTYEGQCESRPTDRRKVMILGGGPNRIGQGIEFDYCCVHAAFALREEGCETIMVNCNPETVSTDYDTSDKLYFEPLTMEEVINIVDREKPAGVIVQLGGQTPLKLAWPLDHREPPAVG